MLGPMTREDVHDRMWWVFSTSLVVNGMCPALEVFSL